MSDHTSSQFTVTDVAAINGCEIDSRTTMVRALLAMRRCPGLFSTDQVTGETFATLVETALAAEGL